MATKSTTSTANGSKTMTDAAKAASSDYDALKKDIAQLRDDLQSFAGNSSKYVRSRSAAEFDKNVERGREYATKAGEQASSAKDYLEDRVRKNPIASVGVAFGAGVLLAALRRK